MSRNRSYTVAAIIAMAGFAAHAAAGQANAGQANAGNEGTQIRTGVGVASFMLDDPLGVTSPAWRVNNDLVEKDGTVPPPSSGWVVQNAVIVRGNAAAADNIPFPNAPIDGVPGFTRITTPNAEIAIALADELHAGGDFDEVYVDMERPRTLRALPTDPSFGNQWHLRNTSVPIADVNAEGAWALGYTGAGVTVGILEGGWQYNHPDLAANYNAAATQQGGATSHATACAGIAAAVGNNGQGGAGAAFNADLSGQLYGGSSTTAAAFAFRNDLNDIKSNSWGPPDNGRLHFISSVEYAALETGVLTGRGGLGTIYAWAAGNGGLGDRVEYDPYAASRFTLAIGSVGDQDVRASYNEQGSSMLVVTHSSGNNRGTWTTTTGSGYTSSFGGTSSASPLAAGVVALMLEANPALTWRDVQAVLIESARKVHPTDGDWSVNAAGYDISYDYGFGAIDAEDVVLVAETWTNLPEEVSISSGVNTFNASIPDNDSGGITRTINVADDINIETVELILNVQSTYIGDLRIRLTSPAGTEAVLTIPRGDSQDNMVNYRLTSLRQYGEASAGDWTLRISDEGASDLATLQNAEIRVFGTVISNPTCPADITGPAQDGVPDSVTDAADLTFFLDQYVAQFATAGGTGPNGFSADLTGPALQGSPDGTVDAADLTFFLEQYIICLD